MRNVNYLLEIKNGNKEVFDAFMREYWRSVTIFVYRYIRDREAAEDLAQDVFVNLWLGRDRLDVNSSIAGYLYVSARNLAYNHLRNNRRLRDRLEKLEFTPEMAEAYMVEEESFRMLDQALSQLPARTAQVLRLTIDGMSREEIAAEMDVSISNVKNLKAIGIKKLRKIMGDSFHIIAIFFM